MAVPTLPDNTETRASDALQAAYFRSALVEQHAAITAELARQTRSLNAMSTKSDAAAIGRLRREIRTNEAERDDVDRMIAALDRRFPAPCHRPIVGDAGERSDR